VIEEILKAYMIIKILNHPHPPPLVEITFGQPDGCLSSVA